MTGKGSINHNCRKFHAENTDPERSYLNVEYCNENIKEVYHELFDEAIERYNAKQTRKDRCIDDYYEKIRSGKQEKLFHEIIMQIGNKEDCVSDSRNGIIAAKVLDEYMKDFQQRNPTLRVFSAHLHMDEATPHLHIDFVPYITESKRGVDTRVSLKQALGALGFKGGSRGDTELNQWINAEKEQLALVMERHGIEWEKKGTHEEHLSVLEYKKKERAKEVMELENLLEEKKNDIQNLNHMLQENQKMLEVSEAEIEDVELKKAEAIQKAENVRKKVDKAEQELKNVAPLVSKVKNFAGDYTRPAAELLPEVGRFETGKGYRENKAIPFFQKLMDKVLSLYVAYCKIQDKCKQLERENTDIWRRKERLQGQNQILQEKVETLERVEEDYGRIRNVFGEERIDRILIEVKEQEHVDEEVEKERRKLLKRKQRDAR
ncbi:MAG: plasmid recombination protein [Lachnospiraceae bacterium]|nr:plasmid recombination protein [Lachnospiraceae bacterium]